MIKKYEMPPEFVKFKKYADNYPDIDGAGVIIYCQYTHRFLLIKNKENKYGFPKGYCKKDEKQIDCAFRELKEETGITKYFKINSYVIIKKRIYYIIIINNEFKLDKEKIISKDEIKDIEWCNISYIHKDNKTVAVKVLCLYYLRFRLMYESFMDKFNDIKEVSKLEWRP